MTLGCTETGKTVLIKRFCEQQFERRYEPTIGVDFGVTSAHIQFHDNTPCDIRVDMFDTSGDEEYFEVRKEFYSDGIDGVLLVFDVNDHQTFKALDKLLNEAKCHGLDIRSTAIVICGNKIDNKQEMGQEEVSTLDGIEYAKKLDKSFYFETSALNGHNVTRAFQCLFDNVMLIVDKGYVNES